MKYTLLLSLIFYFAITTSIAQQTFNAGLLAGTVTSQIHGDAVGGFNKIGLNFGGFVTTELTEKLSSGFEIYYINKGSRKNPSKFNPYYWSIRLNYIEIPVLLKYRIKKITIEAGLSYARLVNQKFLDNGIGYTPASYRLFNKNEYAAIAGIRYNINSNLSFSFRGSQSIWKVRGVTFTYPRLYLFDFQAGSVNLFLNIVAHYQLGKKN